MKNFKQYLLSVTIVPMNQIPYYVSCGEMPGIENVLQHKKSRTIGALLFLCFMLADGKFPDPPSHVKNLMLTAEG